MIWPALMQLASTIIASGHRVVSTNILTTTRNIWCTSCYLTPTSTQHTISRGGVTWTHSLTLWACTTINCISTFSSCLATSDCVGGPTTWEATLCSGVVPTATHTPHQLTQYKTSQQGISIALHLWTEAVQQVVNWHRRYYYKFTVQSVW